MTDERRNERLDRILSEEIRAEYSPEEAPRDQIWAAIQESRSARRGRLRRAVWIAAGFAAAAVVVLIIARGPRPVPLAPSPERAASVAVDPTDLLLRAHLARTSRLLAAAGEDPLSADALRESRSLLAATRTLLDAPNRAPETTRLLEDAELALALVVRGEGAPTAIERQALRDALAEGRVAERLRAAGRIGGG